MSEQFIDTSNAHAYNKAHYKSTQNHAIQWNNITKPEHNNRWHNMQRNLDI